MGAIETFWHLSGFAAPALAVGLAVALCGRLFLARGAGRFGWVGHAALNTGAGLIALAAGLWWFGVDGKMATYAALVGAVATSEWLCSHAWRG